MGRTSGKSGKASAKKSAPKPKTPKQSSGPALIKKEITMFKSQKDWFRMDRKYDNMGFSTRAIHAGCNPDLLHGGVNPSIELSSTYAQPAPGQPSSCFDYSRCGNPTILALQRNLASLEGAKYALAFNSGCNATITVFSLLSQGDHFICIDDVYGGTQRYLRKIHTPLTGMEWDMIDCTDLKLVRKTFRKNTKLVWIETPTNPTLKCTDIAGIAKICKEKGAMLLVDNTFMSPVLQNPLKLGATMAYHSITKYIGGHSDVVAGCLQFNDSDLYDRLEFNMKTLGTTISPFDAYIALRGIKTLDLRVNKAAENALAIAKMLEKHPKIQRVVYPGLPSHPHYATALKNRASKSQSGGSGMISFYINGDINKANKFLSSVKVITLAESLGGVESLIENPALMTHGSVPPAHRKMLGIDDNFCRLSVGIENLQDLLDDLKQALAKI